jgi:hypothetical protein
MSAKRRITTKSSLSRDALLEVFQEMSDELGRRGVTGELCLLGGAVMEIVAAYYHQDKVPMKAQYLVEGLFAEGKV